MSLGNALFSIKESIRWNLLIETRVLKLELMKFTSYCLNLLLDLRQNGKTLLIVNIDLEPGAVDPQLRVLLQWLVASEAEVEELYFQDSSKKEFILVSTSPLVQL